MTYIEDPPDELKDAVRYDKLVLFVGAGVSRLIGLPSWVEFAEKFLEFTSHLSKISI